ncbi:PopZ family protein [Hoeflea sp. G2-23]|uniref:PopZ family protein n=1 Tax=Hoeflea algicola TaxID=2983763 RepID=A0ABT3Z5R1_9HYPH|nr:PopZ family protein [Hoeflea algicola]MCY0147095.1 PopZ family protein [Hoeflea algicola]
MGQAGAQREPSMEEILASIRRIIENNEPAGENEAGAAYDGAHDDYADESESDFESSVSNGVRGKGFASDDVTEDEATEQSAAPEEPQRSEPVSLADVAARVRLSPEALAAVAADPGADAEAAIDDAVAEELRQALVSNDPVVSIAPRLETVEPVKSSEPAKQEDTEVQQESEPKIASAGKPETGGSQLVSLHTGEKVAAAFDELSSAIAAGQTRSFDEIAEEMLKPMLSQWLDDNLPTLVERLVREEIERVSRGNRS